MVGLDWNGMGRNEVEAREGTRGRRRSAMVRRLNRGNGKRRSTLSVRRIMVESDGQRRSDGRRTVGRKLAIGLGREKSNGSGSFVVDGERGQAR